MMTKYNSLKNLWEYLANQIVYDLRIAGTGLVTNTNTHRSV